MNTEVAVVENRAPTLTAAQIKGHVQLIQQVMQAVMKGPSKDNPNGVHYGVVPGTDKPTLLKPGAEILVATFRIAVDPQAEDLSGGDEIRYRVRCVGTHQTTGVVLGIGIGECSSGEEKYKWRRAICDEEFDAAPEERKRVKYARGKNNSHYTIKQIRTEPADVANTILKMAKKRALVDFTLTALAASDIFAQDLEDMPEEVRESVTEGDGQKRTVQQPKAKSETNAETQVDPSKKATESQVNFIRKKLTEHVTEKALCEHFKVEKLEDLPFAEVNRALVYIGEQTSE